MNSRGRAMKNKNMKIICCMKNLSYLDFFNIGMIKTEHLFYDL